MNELLFLYVVIGFCVFLATFGHLLGAKKPMHMLDILWISVAAGLLWPYLPYLLKKEKR